MLVVRPAPVGLRRALVEKPATPEMAREGLGSPKATAFIARASAPHTLAKKKGLLRMGGKGTGNKHNRAAKGEGKREGTIFSNRVLQGASKRLP